MGTRARYVKVAAMLAIVTIGGLLVGDAVAKLRAEVAGLRAEVVRLASNRATLIQKELPMTTTWPIGNGEVKDHSTPGIPGEDWTTWKARHDAEVAEAMKECPPVVE